jgi:hypothetical protein
MPAHIPLLSPGPLPWKLLSKRQIHAGRRCTTPSPPSHS